MPDTTTEAKPAEIIAASRQKVETPTFADGAKGAQKEAQDRMTAATEKTNKINEAREKDPDNFKTMVEAAAKPPDYSSKDFDETIDALGKDEEPVKDLSAALQPISQYLEASRSALLKGSDITTELTAARLNAADIQKGVAEILISRGRLLEKFPDLKVAFGAENQGTLNAFVEQALARDPRFQSAMAEVLREIHDEAQVIEKPSEQSKEAKKIKELHDTQIDSLKNRLKALGVGDTDIEEVVKKIDVGDSGLTLISAMEAIAKAKGINNIDWLTNYQKGLSTFNEREKELLQANKNLGIEEAKKGNQRNQSYIDSLTSQIGTLQEQASLAKASIDSTQKSYDTTFGTKDDGTVENVFTADLQKLQSARAVLSEDNAINRTINFLHTNAQRLKDAETALVSESGGDAGEREKQRKQKIEELTKRLEASVDTAMSKFLEQKYKDYVDDQNILINASIKEAEEKGKNWKADGLKSIKDYMDKWSNFDGKKYSRDNNAIGVSLKDMATKSAYGENGVRQILAEKAGFQLDPEKLKDNIAKEIRPMRPDYSSLSDDDKKKDDAMRTYENLTPEEKLIADKIAETRTAEFEEIVTEQGEKFKERLFVEYNAAKGFMDKIGHGELSLTNDQVEILNTQFASLEKTIEKSGLFKALKEKGLIPDSKKKWIIMLLILLGGAALTAGIAPTAVAAASAAKGIGGAALNEGVV